PHLRLLGLGEEVPDLVEHAGVGGGVGARAAADGRLVDVDDLVEVLGALDGAVAAGHRLRPVDPLHQGVVQDVVDQRRLPAAAHPGDGHQAAEGELDVDAVEVVLPGPPYGDPVLSRRAAHLGDGDLPAAGQVGAGDRPRFGHQVVERSFYNDLAAVDPGAG